MNKVTENPAPAQGEQSKIGQGWEIHSHAPYSIWKGDKQVASFLWTLEDGSYSPVCEKTSVAAENAAFALRAVTCHDELVGALNLAILSIETDNPAYATRKAALGKAGAA